MHVGRVQLTGFFRRMSALERFVLLHGYSLNRWLPSLELHGVWRDHHSMCVVSKAHSADVGIEDGLVKKRKAQSAARRGHSEILARKHHQVLRSTSQLVHVHNVGHPEASDIVMRARTCRDAAIRRLRESCTLWHVRGAHAASSVAELAGIA